jgi:ribosome recycling factor
MPASARVSAWKSRLSSEYSTKSDTRASFPQREIRTLLFSIYDLRFTPFLIRDLSEFVMTEKDVIKETKPRMEAAIDDVRRKLATVRTGRAAVSLLDAVMVDYYGTPTPLNQMASVHAPEPQMLTVQPWDPTQIGNVEKAVRTADLGLNPSNDGKLVRIPIPALTEERRKQLAKQVHEIAEEHRTAIRNIRRDENDKLKKMLKDKTISEDNERDGLDEVQKLTDTYISKIDDLSKSKEHEIMNV